MEKIIIDGCNIDLSRISTTASGASNGQFVSSVRQSAFSGELECVVRDDGTYLLYKDGTAIGFTDQIYLGEAEPEVQEQIEESIPQEETQPENPVEEVTQTTDTSTAARTEDIELSTEMTEETAESVQQATPVETVNNGESYIIEIPDSVKQTGICKNNTNYSYFFDKWNSGSRQQALAKVWDQQGRGNDRGIATINGRYLVAVSEKFGKVGDEINVTLRDGQVIPCIIGDAKGDDAQNEYGHILSGRVDVIEWESFHDRDEINIDGWHNLGVSYIENTNNNVLG